MTQKIEGKFSLWQKEIPKVGKKNGINVRQDSQAVVLEGANGVLHLITAMHIRGEELEFGVPLEGDGFFVCRAGFVSRIWRSTERPRVARRIMIEL